MKVKCKYNKVNQIKNELIRNELKKIILLDEDYEIGLNISEVYDVYGLYFSKEGAMYFICEDSDDKYPIGQHASFFEIIDSSIPCDWKFVYRDTDESYIVPKVWADDSMFYEKLLDGEEKEELIFQKIKEKYTNSLPSLLSGSV